MSPSAPKGFCHTPVSKAALLATVALPVLVSMLDLKYALVLQFDPFIFQWGQYWRLLLNQLCFVSESQVFFGAIVLYNLRVLERLKSPHRYISLLVLIYSLHILLQMGGNFVLKVLLPDSWNPVQSFNYASGPFPVLGALVYQYYALIPTAYKFEITDFLPQGSSEGDAAAAASSSPRIVLTDKFNVYILTLHLALSEGFDSLVPFLSGWLLAFLVESEIIPGKSWRLPFFKEVYKFIYKNTTILRPIGGTATPTNAATADVADGARQTTPTENDAEPVRPLATQFLDSIRR